MKSSIFLISELLVGQGLSLLSNNFLNNERRSHHYNKIYSYIWSVL